MSLLEVFYFKFLNKCIMFMFNMVHIFVLHVLMCFALLALNIGSRAVHFYLGMTTALWVRSLPLLLARIGLYSYGSKKATRWAQLSDLRQPATCNSAVTWTAQRTRLHLQFCIAGRHYLDRDIQLQGIPGNISIVCVRRLSSLNCSMGFWEVFLFSLRNTCNVFL